MNAFLWMLIITVAPFIELRGSIPVGVASGLNPYLVFVSATVANIILIPILFLILSFVFDKLGDIPVIGKWVEIRLEKIDKKAGKYVDKYGYVGLALFVAIPLPGSGAYSGTLAAFLLSMDKKKSMCAIAVGVLIAGLIVSLASLGILNLVL